MLKSLYVGVGLLGFILLFSAMLQDTAILMKLSGGLGIACLLLSGIFVGAFNGGDRIRANYHSESKAHRDQRTSWSVNLLIVGAINILGAILTFIIVNS